MNRKIKKSVKDLIGTFYFHCYFKHKKLSGNRILIYHAFGSKISYDSYGISIDPLTFEEHLVFLKQNYELTSIGQNSDENFKDKITVSISIDDGYKDTLVAIELLEKYDIPYTVYIVSGFLGKRLFLSKNDVKNMAKSSLCTIGSHTVNHRPLSTLSEKKQVFEIVDSKKMLEDIIGKQVVHFSYPYGDYDKKSKEIAENTYDVISTSHIGINPFNADKKMLKRVEIVATDSIYEVNKKILGYYDYLKLNNILKNIYSNKSIKEEKNNIEKQISEGKKNE